MRIYHPNIVIVDYVQRAFYWLVFITGKQLEKGRNKMAKAKIDKLEIAANGPREHI
jgi:hypothetical protein